MGRSFFSDRPKINWPKQTRLRQIAEAFHKARIIMVDALRPQGHEAEDIDSFDTALQKIADLEVENQRLYRQLHKVLMIRIEIRKGESSLIERDDRLIAELNSLFQKKPMPQLPAGDVETEVTVEDPPQE